MSEEVEAVYYAYWIRGPRRAPKPFFSTNDPPILPKHYKQYMRIGSVLKQVKAVIMPFKSTT